MSLLVLPYSISQMHHGKMLHACIRPIRALFPSPVLKKVAKEVGVLKSGCGSSDMHFCSFIYEHTAHTPELNFQWVLDLQKVHKLETPF